jgi:hypothetical protein
MNRLWVKLDTGMTKRTTFMKKLLLLPPKTIIGLQIESHPGVVISRVFMRASTIVTAIEKVSGTLTVPDFVKSSVISNKEEREGLVNNFRGITIGIFAQVVNGNVSTN